MIQTITKITFEIDNTFIHKVVYQDNTVMYVPDDIKNRHYQEILEWVADGNTITNETVEEEIIIEGGE